VYYKHYQNQNINWTISYKKDTRYPPVEDKIVTFSTPNSYLPFQLFLLVMRIRFQGALIVFLPPPPPPSLTKKKSEKNWPKKTNDPWESRKNRDSSIQMRCGET